jgi:NAD(P)-dependent dehydrogenase (short-subunit alcohol dehydrogenase family)
MTSIKDSVILITGATNGIGKATAAKLALKGARIVVHGRDDKRVENVLAEIRRKTGSSKVDGILGDFTSLKSVKSMADEFKSRYDRLDVLINNAGVLFLTEKFSSDGYEITFAVNYLSHFLLTNLLLDLLKKSSPSRIITVSSVAHTYLNSIDISRLTASGGYNRLMAYSASKICENLFAFELADRLKEFGIVSNALHPGIVRTGIGLNSKNPLLLALINIFKLCLLSPDKGAETSVYLASSDEVKDITGKYFYKCKPVKYAKNSSDREAGKRLWKLSENLVKDFI